MDHTSATLPAPMCVSSFVVPKLPRAHNRYVPGAAARSFELTLARPISRARSIMPAALSRSTW